MNENKLIKTNAYITNVDYIEEGIGWRLILPENEIPSRPQIVLVIDERISLNKIINSWKHIQRLRDWYLKEFGNDLNINYDIVLLELQILHEHSFGYGEIAKILNYRNLALLCCAYYGNEKLENQSLGFGLYALFTQFIALRLGSNRFEEEISNGYELLDEGILPWKIRGGPIDAKKVSERLRYFKKRIQKGNLIIKEHPLDIDPVMIDAFLLLNGWYDKVNDLWQRGDRNYWERHNGWIVSRLDFIKDAIDRSNSRIIIDMR